MNRKDSKMNRFGDSGSDGEVVVDVNGLTSVEKGPSLHSNDSSSATETASSYSARRTLMGPAPERGPDQRELRALTRPKNGGTIASFMKVRKVADLAPWRLYSDPSSHS